MDKVEKTPDKLDSSTGGLTPRAHACLLRRLVSRVQPRLVHGGAEPTLQDKNGRTALYLAVRYLHWNVVIFLINNMRHSDLGAETKRGQSVLSEALCWGNFTFDLSCSIWHQVLASTNPIKVMLTATVTTDDPALLKRLLRRVPKDLVASLLTHRALVGGTPLYAAATSSWEDIIDVLLDAGADLELEDGDRGTPLMGACAAGRLEVVRTLVRKGTRTSCTKDGQLIGAFSTARLHPKVTRWLLVERFMEGPLSIENRKV
ncbi:hypothetical protein IMSHALPRED_004406 [Imshaugia aleurites]|uniref:Ankyrin n=1 Tax=Imshaugia aleurites TaxID=172621 RepID=A0A8H3F3Q5_9LECA|nr:hypothetical protein IMSHALPRED_004406 [Imshaugia aleurites]